MNLIIAVIKNDVAAVSALLSKNADPNTVEDICNVTALHHAAQHDSVGAATLLINAGSKLDARTIDGLTPLEIARMHNSGGMIKLLSNVGLIFNGKKVH